MDKKLIKLSSIEAERGALGSMLIDKIAMAKAIEKLKPSDFYEQRHEIIFDIIKKMVVDNEKIDLLTLAQKLKDKNELVRCGGRAYLCELVEGCVTSSHVEGYIGIIKQKSVLRRLQNASLNIASIPLRDGIDGEEMINSIQKALTQTLGELTNEKTREEEISLSDALMLAWTERKEDTDHGVFTGIEKIDNITVGLKPGHFWIIGGYTSVGKTQLALYIADYVARQHKVCFYSLEMTTRDIAGRLLKIAEQTKKENEALDYVHGLSKNFRIIQNKVSLSEIEAHIICNEEKPEVIFVDFIQNVETTDKTEYERLNRVARRLQKLALQQGVCIVALSQVSNESAKNVSNKTIGFKGSGALAHACDVGIELVRDKENGDENFEDLECHLKKNRHGRTAKIMFCFDKIKNKIIFNNISNVKSNQSSSTGLDFDKGREYSKEELGI